MKSLQKIIWEILNQTNQTDQQRFLLAICKDILTNLKADRCILYTLDKRANELYTSWITEKDGRRLVAQVRLPRGEGIAGWVALHHEPVIVDDASQDKRYQEENNKIEKKAVLAVPLMAFGTLLGVLEVVSNNHRKFLRSDIGFIQPFANIIALTIPREDSEALTRLAEICIRFLEERDPYTHGHSLRVTQYCMILAEELKIPKSIKQELRLCALLHDIGKITIKDALLSKETNLTKLEFQSIRTHPLMGFNILAPINKPLAQAVLSHHENHDGTGYPHGLKGEEIPLMARIIRLIDAFDAMTTDRPYRDAVEIDTVIKEIEETAGIQFDPKIVKTFLETYRDGKINLLKV